MAVKIHRNLLKKRKSFLVKKMFEQKYLKKIMPST